MSFIGTLLDIFNRPHYVWMFSGEFLNNNAAVRLGPRNYHELLQILGLELAAKAMEKITKLV